MVYKNISYFLPMSWKVRHQKGRKLRSLLPLFSSYMFFCGNEKQRLEVLRTNRVANLIKVTDRQKLLEELSQIEIALRAGMPLEPHKYIKKGQQCRVIAGPLAELQGIVLREPQQIEVASSLRKPSTTARLVLQIEMLGQAASVEIDTDMIEVVENE